MSPAQLCLNSTLLFSNDCHHQKTNHLKLQCPGEKKFSLYPQQDDE